MNTANILGRAKVTSKTIRGGVKNVSRTEHYAGGHPDLPAFVNASPVTISFGLHTMPGGLDEQAAGKFQQYVSEMSDGQMKVELFPGAVLGGEKSCWNSSRSARSTW